MGTNVPRGMRTATAFREKHADKIDVFYHDSDGWWLELKSGWMSEAYSYGHIIHEDTVAECISRFRWIEAWPDDPDLGVQS